MHRLMAAVIVVASAIALAIGPALLITQPAHASTAPITRIGWNVGKDACLGVPHDHAKAGQQLAIMDCSSNLTDPAEAWVLGDGHLRLHGTHLWAVVDTARGQNQNTIELSHHRGPADWVYGPTHTIHIGKGWLTWCGPGPVFYYPHFIRNCQTWYAFTAPPPQIQLTAKRCVSHYDWNSGTNYTVLGGRDYGEAWWTSNPGKCQSMQVKISCVTALTGQLYSNTSGVVRGVNIKDKARCGYGDAGLAVAISINGGTYKTLCTQPATGSLPSCNFGITRKT